MKPDRLEDLGRIREKLSQLLDEPLIRDADSKHDFERWKKNHHDMIEHDEPKGLDGIFGQIRWLRSQIEEIYYLSCGDEYE